MVTKFTRRCDVRNNGGIATGYTRSIKGWNVLFQSDGELSLLSVPGNSQRSVRTILKEDYGIDILDAIVEPIM